MKTDQLARARRLFGAIPVSAEDAMAVIRAIKADLTSVGAVMPATQERVNELLLREEIAPR
jgi:hypothetical protein